MSTDTYKTLLDSVLNAIHRDDGQYTLLAGYETSVDEAIKVATYTRSELRRLQALRKGKAHG
jgi:hypothetical protein